MTRLQVQLLEHLKKAPNQWHPVGDLPGGPTQRSAGLDGLAKNLRQADSRWALDYQRAGCKSRVRLIRLADNSLA